MLVLSRRPNERILFPNLGISIEILSVCGQRVRIGIDAPKQMTILREEILPTEAVRSTGKDFDHLVLDHETRNRLNHAWLSIQLAQKQLAHGKGEDAEATLKVALASFESIERQLDLFSANKAKRPIRTLVVEDDDNENMLLASILRMSGFEVDTARDGKDALEYLETHECPDVIVLDMRMPRLDGPSTISSIRYNPSFDQLKIFAVSGSRASEFPISIGEKGVDRWFSKPLNAQKLIEDLRATIPAA